MLEEAVIISDIEYEKTGVVKLAHTSPTPLHSLYIQVGSSLFTLESGGQAAYMETIALHWVPIPMPTHTHGFWVGMGAILLFMGGHGWASVLCIPASNSKSKSNFLDARNMLAKKHSGLKPRQ